MTTTRANLGYCEGYRMTAGKIHLCNRLIVNPRTGNCDRPGDHVIDGVPLAGYSLGEDN